MSSAIDRGSYDDLVEDPELRRGRPHLPRAKRERAASRGRGGQQKRSQSHEPPRGDEMTDYEPGTPMAEPQQQPPLMEEETELQLEEPLLPEVDPMRLLNDPSYNPMMHEGQGPLMQHEPFLRARHRHEMLERPHHVQRAEALQPPGEPHPEVPVPGPEDDDLMVDTGYFMDNPDDEDMVFAVTLPAPQSEAEWRAIVKDPQRFVGKKVAKGVEVSWRKLNVEQRRAMNEAMQLELKDWISNKVCRAAVGHVPRERIMKMRWVLVFKDTSTKGTVKAKARLVVLGCSDPDYANINTKSPTMSRRSRQLLLQLATHRGWSLLKGDVKTAFLQGDENQLGRSIFGYPPEELREAMGLEPGQLVQFAKAAYGLTIAPREFYKKADRIIHNLGLERLKTEPCMWRFRAPVQGRLQTIGLIGCHVDDFLIVGQESDSRWKKLVEAFHASLTWSPWECAPMTHCGVALQTLPDGSWRLDQRDFCGEISQVREEGRHSDMTNQEMTQCRAVLGAIQWRVYQTGPQHAAKLGHLQSIISKGDRSTIAEVNKLVREVHAQRDVGLVIHQLCAERDEDLVLVGWSDAALANRPDLSSTGGYIIGFVHKNMVEDGVRGPVNVMSWSSNKLRRVCRSSLAAETQALGECEQELMFMRVQWTEMLGHDIKLDEPAESASKTPGVLVIDAKALFDAAKNGDIQSSAFSMKEKYTALELLGLVQHLSAQKTELRWCNSDAQLADGLTKTSAQDRIKRFLVSGQMWNLKYDENFVSAKKVKKSLKEAEAAEDGPRTTDPSWLDLLRQSQSLPANTFGGVQESQPLDVNLFSFG